MRSTELSHCYPQTARAAPSSSLLINTIRTSLWARYIQFRLCHPVYRTNREQQPGFLICSQNTREEYMCIISCQHYTPNASRCTIRTRLHCLRHQTPFDLMLLLGAAGDGINANCIYNFFFTLNVAAAYHACMCITNLGHIGYCPSAILSATSLCSPWHVPCQK